MESWRQLQPIINRIAPLAFQQGLKALLPAERIVVLTWSYSGAIDNGGHASFFYNSYGEYAHETIKALEDMGASAYAHILNRATDLFPNRHVPQDLEARNDALGDLPESADSALNNLDGEYYGLGSDELMDRLLKFWNKHGSQAP